MVEEKLEKTTTPNETFQLLKILEEIGRERMAEEFKISLLDPYRLIKLFSYIGETVLDPFLGSGTTSKVARQLKRNSIGYEIDKSLIEIIKNKIGFNQGDVFGQEDIIDLIDQRTGRIIETNLKEKK